MLFSFLRRGLPEASGPILPFQKRYTQSLQASEITFTFTAYFLEWGWGKNKNLSI